MVETPLDKLAQLVKAAPLPTEPPAGEEELQSEGDDPKTELTNLTTAEFIESCLARDHELRNITVEDEITRQRRLDELRDEYIPKLFWMMIGWLAFVAACVTAVGFKCLLLSDAVIIALITTTTATVLGIFIIVAKWLFPPPKEK